MKKRILAGVLASAAALTAVSFTGCADAGKDTLTILAWSSNTDVNPMIEFFCEQTGVSKDKIKWATVGEKGENARDQYGTYLDSSQDADIIFCDAEWAKMYANNDNYTVGLDTIGITKDQFNGAYPYTMKIGTSDAGVFKGATWQATPGGFVYRADYAEQYLGVKSPEEMQALVSDWAKFEETAGKLAEQGVAICATEGGLWQVKQCEKSSPWVVDGKLVIDDAAKSFFQMAKDYADKKYITTVTQWSPDWYPTVTTGKALGDFAPTWGLTSGTGSIADNFAEQKEGVMGFCEGPANFYWGGTFMMVTKKCNTPDLAKQWIETFATNTETMEAYAKKTGDFMNNKSIMDKLAADDTLKSPIYKNGTHQFKLLVKIAEGIDLSVTEYDGIIKGEFNTAVQGYAINGTTDSVDAAIQAFKDGVKKKYPAIVE